MAAEYCAKLVASITPRSRSMLRIPGIAAFAMNAHANSPGLDGWQRPLEVASGVPRVWMAVASYLCEVLSGFSTVVFCSLGTRRAHNCFTVLIGALRWE